MNFRANLASLRSSHHLTQEQLAEMLGVSRQSVTKWESGKSTPEMDKLIKLCDIFSCTLDELVCGDLTDREDPTSPEDPTDREDPTSPEDPTNSEDPTSPEDPTSREDQPSLRAASEPSDCYGYEEEWRSFALNISLGVGSFILAPAVLCLMQVAGALFGIAPKVSEAVGVFALLALVALGLALVIPAGLRHGAFMKRHPSIEDFYTAEEREEGQERFVRHLVGGILLILAGVAACVLVENLLSFGDLGAGLLLGCVAVGVWSIVYGSILWGSMDINAYNNQAAEYIRESSGGDGDLFAKGRRDRVTSGLCGAIMLVATIAGFIMLFLPGFTTPFFWLAWPVGGLLCGVVSCLTSAFMAKE